VKYSISGTIFLSNIPTKPRKGGIIIPDSAKEKPLEGEVISVGPGRTMDDGSVRELAVKKGDKILFGKYSGTEVKIDGEVKSINLVEYANEKWGMKVVEVNNENRGAYVWPDKGDYLLFVTFADASGAEDMPKPGERVDIEYVPCEVGDMLATVTGADNKIYCGQKVVRKIKGQGAQ